MYSDLLLLLRFWGVLLVIGLIFLPLNSLLFRNLKDTLYPFSKILGLSILSYLVFVIGVLHILPFSFSLVIVTLLVLACINFILYKKKKIKIKINKLIIFEEALFLSGLVFWSYIRSFAPDIFGLEKYMDYGFINSILRTDYFPPKDMWFTPLSINYYYFGHLYTAVLTKLSVIPSNITYNLTVSAIFSFTLVGAFSIIYNLLSSLGNKKSFFGGILGGLVLSLGGNLHTIYSFYSAYQGEKPVPLWRLNFLPNTFPNNYWYPNATRFIPFTIHEFPIYSFVVSDLHGHVLDIPIVLFVIGILLSLLKDEKLSKIKAVLISFALALMYMTNVWDGLIYLLLFSIVVIFLNLRILEITFFKSKKIIGVPKIKSINNIKSFIEKIIFQAGSVVILYFIFTLPFNLNFKPFVSGIGLVCPPSFLVNLGKIGPFIFEADHCQKSPLYQLLTLYGFFIFFSLSFLIFLASNLKLLKNRLLDRSNVFILILILLGFFLIIVPEFLYAKDIYPAHYRANTMFKLVYQSFILLTISSVYIIIYLITKIKNKFWKLLFLLSSVVLLSLILIYPYFAIGSYYLNLKQYKGLDGTKYLKTLHPGDFEAINYLNKNVKGQPVILEAQGDSYTDYERISANTGLPTVLGWTVHEWLWRGTYDIPAPRIEEVKTLYEGDLYETLSLLDKYKVSYVIVGQLEKEKYPQLNNEKFKELGKKIFESKDGDTIIYKIKG